jgi:glycosyltransferase involved in cell wall biosynthesis
MAHELPTISIVTPSYNQARFLERTIESVLDQGYPRLEYIVLDGGSTDGSLEIIERYGPRLAFWTSGPDGGQAAAINAGWRRSQGEVLAWLNSDDFYLPGALLEIGEAFAAHPEADLIYGLMRRVDGDGKPMGMVGSSFSWRTMLYSHQVIPQPSAFFRRSAVDDVGLLDESLHYSMDYDFFLRLARGRRALMLPRPLAVATVHGDAKTTRDRAEAGAETHRVRKRHARGLGAVLVRLQPAFAGAFRRMPAPARALIGRLRPRRVYEEVLAPARAPDPPG